MKRLVVFMLFFLLVPLLATADDHDAARSEATWWQRFRTRTVETWNSPTWDVYLPFLTWHNRLTYDRSKIDNYNETPWGAGIGKSMYDEDGDWHALYAIGFQDSHNMFQPMAGYAFQKNWRLDKDGDWRLGVGLVSGITARQQYNYIPLPLILPMAGVEYKRLALQGVYIPGTRNNGNVLFCWLRWQLN